VQVSGIVEEGRPLQAVAGHKYLYHNTTIYILIDTENKDTITDAQRKAINTLIKKLQYEYPEVRVVKV
jgi:hypothetical protein